MFKLQIDSNNNLNIGYCLEFGILYIHTYRYSGGNVKIVFCFTAIIR
jgi:hypothetical protein